MRGFRLSAKRGRFRIFARADEMGEDLLVTIWGGVVHVGAVAMAAPRPSLRDPRRTSATSSVFTFPGHKEDVTVKTISEMLSATLGRKAIVIAGIHWDDLQPEDIGLIADACRALGERIAAKISKR